MDENNDQSQADVQRFIDFAAPGHFYSPLPDHREITRQAGRIFAMPDELPGIDIRGNEQLALFSRLCTFAHDIDPPESPDPRFRYYADNPNYGIGDALMLGAFLRFLKPRHYLEVGSGWTTALALDINERFLGCSMRIGAVEPHPNLVRDLIRPTDNLEIIETPVQDVPLERFSELEENDVLFIDDSHVVKTGSDAHFLITRVLPVLAPGVVVHIHDVFWPFEYPRAWIDAGRAWNEAYLLHAFLAFNETFRIVFFNNWFADVHREIVESELPMMMENPGGAIWLQRMR